CAVFPVALITTSPSESDDVLSTVKVLHSGCIVTLVARRTGRCAGCEKTVVTERTRVRKRSVFICHDKNRLRLKYATKIARDTRKTIDKTLVIVPRTFSCF